MNSPITCPNCGAPVTKAICQYCGTLVVTNPGIDVQKQALELYHGLLASKDISSQVSLLSSGFLPDSSDVLVEAGLRCIPLLHGSSTKLSDAAAGRLRAVTLKLGLKEQDGTIPKAIDEFEKQISEQKKRSNYSALIGLAMLIGGIVLVVGLISLVVMLVS